MEASPAQAGASSAEATPVAKRPRTDESVVQQFNIATQIGWLPQGIHLCVLGGIRGSGKHSTSALLQGRLQNLAIPVMVIDSDTFLEIRPHCDVCVTSARIRGFTDDRWCLQCLNSPACLNIETLYPAIEQVSAELAATNAFHVSECGVVIIIGRFALECTALMQHAATLSFYLLPISKDICQARPLASQGLWHEPEMDLYADIDSLRMTLEVYVQASD